MRIAVVGAGYVGLSSALVWSHLGHEVRVLDRDAGRIALLRRGEDPLDEPLLPEPMVISPDPDGDRAAAGLI